jgi:hypothetical protein
MLQDEAGAKPDPTRLYAEHAAMKVLLFRLEKRCLRETTDRRRYGL